MLRRAGDGAVLDDRGEEFEGLGVEIHWGEIATGWLVKRPGQ
jgi:hypothetical protein